MDRERWRCVVKPPIVIITNPPKSWCPGDERVEEFMHPVTEAIRRHIPWPSDEFTDIYNRAYEAVWNAIIKYDKGGDRGTI
jgi:hypothetical protein